MSQVHGKDQALFVNRLLPLLSAALMMSAPAMADPPPPPGAPQTLPLTTSVCSLEIAGSARPYAPAIYRFSGELGDTLLLVPETPDRNLNFTLGIVDETPLITGAGFGADVRVRLPRSGAYQLEISSFDPVEYKALSADFRLKIALRSEVIPESC